MQGLYLYVNALLYLLLALWCTVTPSRTSASIGYLTLSNGGHSEYLVIYGGMQLGLAALYLVLARNPEWHRIGIVLSLALYAPMVLYRVVSVAKYWPVAAVTLGTGAIELALFLGALGLYLRRV